MTNLLKIIRKLDGDTSHIHIEEPKQLPRDEPEDERTPCPFATIVSYQAKKLYRCLYTNKCDDQMEIAYKKYCKRELR
jgi:hypothetical protein